MSMALLRKRYGVPVARDRRVTIAATDGRYEEGTVVRATQSNVYILLDGMSRALPYHPADPAITYLCDDRSLSRA